MFACINQFQALYLLHQMKSYKVVLDMYTYTTLIQSLCKEGKLQVAKSIIPRMLRLGIKPDIVSYNSLIYGYCLIGEMDAVRKLFDNMHSIGIELDLSSYITLFNGYFNRRMVDDVSLLLLKMRSTGLMPDLHVYNCLILGCAEFDRDNWVLDIFNELFYTGLRPDTYTLNLVLALLCKTKKVAEVTELLSKMENFDIQRDTVSFNIILHGYFLIGMLNDVIGVFCNLFIKNSMSVVTFNSHSFKGSVSAICVVRHWCYSWKWKWRDSIRTMLHTSCLFRLWCMRNSDHEKASLLRKKMHSAGLPPTSLPTTDGLTTEMLAAVP